MDPDLDLYRALYAGAVRRQSDPALPPTDDAAFAEKVRALARLAWAQADAERRRVPSTTDRSGDGFLVLTGVLG